MMPTRLLLPLLGLFAAGAAAAQSPPLCKPNNNAGACTIEVGVYHINRFGQQRCIVYLPKLIQHFWVGFSGAAAITWQITEANDDAYVFKTAGIVFDDPSQFETPTISADGKAFTLQNRKSTSNRDYKYVIALTNGSINCELDPWVRNQ